MSEKSTLCEQCPGCADDEGFFKILELLKTFFEDDIEKKGMFPSRRKTHYANVLYSNNDSKNRGDCYDFVTVKANQSK
jgi:hypothetical protein